MIPSLVDITSRTRLVFGNGSLARLGLLARELGAGRALIVTDRGIVAAGHVARAVKSLTHEGIEVTVFDEVHENPTTSDVARCLEVARQVGVDLFIGIGGGSSLDTAKGTNLLLTNGGEIRDYWGVGKASRPMLPLIAIPTTAGTGSECQSAALIADEVSHQKMACLDPKVAAKIALLDPELTVSQPFKVTAVTGTDALAHALETAVTTRRNPVSLMHSREAFRLLAHAFPRVLENPKDLESRGQMLLGAAFAGAAIEYSMLGAAHSCANPLTARFHVVHGAAVGLMLPHVIRFNAGEPTACQAYAELALLSGWCRGSSTNEEGMEGLVAHLTQLLAQAKIPQKLAEAGADPAQIPELAAEAAQQWTARFNPRPVAVEDFLRLYQAAV